MKTLSFNNNAGLTVSYLTDLIDGNEQFTVYQILTNTNGTEVVGLTPEVIAAGGDQVKIGVCYMLKDFKDYATTYGYNLIETSEEHPEPIYLVDNRGPELEVLSVVITAGEYVPGDTLPATVSVKNSNISGSGTLHWNLVNSSGETVDSGTEETGTIDRDETKEVLFNIVTDEDLVDDFYTLVASIDEEVWESSNVVEISWSAYWTQRSLFFLDGTIITIGADKYFKDRSSAARNFLITGYDFDSTWTEGFPYKSAATISAPAGDATLIAADINNFLYDAGGTPNAIPVVSLFQNIDYENTIYCRHVAQVLDGNGVETTEPHVIEVFMTEAPLSASDLTKADTYFGVPAKTAGAYWIDPVNGNDSTGAGTEVSPWKTIVGVNAKSLTAGAVVYVKTGIESIGNSFLNTAKNLKWTRTGMFSFISTSTSQVMYVHVATSELIGLIITGVATKPVIYTEAIKNIERCKFISGGNTIAIDPGTNDITLKDSVLFNCNNGIMDSNTLGTVNILGCNSSGTGANLYFAFAIANSKTINIKNNKANKTISLKGTYIEVNIIDNYGIDVVKVTAGVYTGDVNVKYNTFIGKVTSYLIDVRLTLSTVRYDWVIADNIFTCADLNVTAVFLFNQVAPQILRNLITFTGTTNTAGGIYLDSTGQDCGIALVQNNKSINPSPTGVSAIILGNEVVGSSDNAYTGSIISGNYCRYSYYYDRAAANSCHGIFITRNAGCFIKYNWVTGASIGYVFKETADVADYAECLYNLSIDNISNFLSKGVVGVKYYGNTIVRTPLLDDADMAFYGIRLMQNTAATPSINTIIKNNIIVNLGHLITNDYLIYIEDTSDTGLDSDYNIYYSAKANGKLFKIGTNEYTFAEWQALGHDAHSVFLTEAQALALFTDPENNDFSLKAGSVAINFCPVIEGYETGLDASTDWGSDTELPIVVTKTNTGDCGAYVH